MSDSPAAVLFDSAGNPVDVVLEGGTYKLSALAKLLASTALIGKVKLRNPGDTADLGDAANPVRTDPTGTTTQPVSAASLPLPTGAATETTLAAANVNLADIETLLTAIKSTDGIKKITDPLPAGTNNIGDVDVLSSALPAGAATEATLATLATETKLEAVRVLLASIAAEDFATETTLAALLVALVAIKDTAGIKKITDALPAGNNNIGDVDVASSALPAGAATEATLATRGSEATLALVKAKTDNLDVALSTLLTLAGFQARINTLGQKTMANSTPMVLASDQSAIAVTASIVPQNSTPGLSGGLIILGGGSSGSSHRIRATPYTPQAANAQRSLASSSASDASAGTGARTVELTYMKADGSGPFTETVTLNGTTAVNTVATDICSIEKMEVKTVGSGGANAGTISLYTATAGGGTVFGSIGFGNIVSGEGDNQTFWAHHYVPLGKRFSMTGLSVGVGGAGGTCQFHVRSLATTVANSAETPVTGVLIASTQFQRAYTSPVEVTGPARVTVLGVPSTNGMTLTAAMDYYEEVT